MTATEAAAFLNTYRATNKTAAVLYLKLHTADPGAAGTTAASAVTTRNQATWAAPSAGSMAISTLADYSMTTSETITHGSLWDASSAGNFVRSFAFTSGVPVVIGSTLHVASLTLSVTPLAA